MTPEPAVIALGSNLDDPLGKLRTARAELSTLGRVTAASGIYRTAPMGGPPGQPDYLNAVVVLEPLSDPFDPLALLEELLEIERRHGRQRRVRWEARVLDLDLLALGNLVWDRPRLVLPHPRMMERAFVLAPLCEALPEWRHPITGSGACETLADLPTSGVERSDFDWGGDDATS